MTNDQICHTKKVEYENKAHGNHLPFSLCSVQTNIMSYFRFGHLLFSFIKGKRVFSAAFREGPSYRSSH